IHRMALIFGAPVMDPGGNVLASVSVVATPSWIWQVTDEISWCTCLKLCSCKSAEALTVPGSALRVRSLRTRSTIMMFSLISLGLETSAFLSASSSPAVLPRGAVPFIGCDNNVRPFLERKRSGDAERMYFCPNLKKHEKG